MVDGRWSMGYGDGIRHRPSTINHQPSTINHQPSTIDHPILIGVDRRSSAVPKAFPAGYAALPWVGQTGRAAMAGTAARRRAVTCSRTVATRASTSAWLSVSGVSPAAALVTM